MTKQEFELQLKEMEDTFFETIEDIQISADMRIEAIKQELQDEIADRIQEELEWNREAENRRKYFYDEDYISRSIFEQKLEINTPSAPKKNIARKKYKNLSESEWTSAGFSAYQDPNNAQTTERLRLQQTASIYQYINYPIAHSIIENLKRYVLGRGINIDCPVEPIMKVIRNFWSVNNLESRNKKAFVTYLLNGEYFPLLFVNNSSDFDSEVDSVLIFKSVPSVEIDEIELDSEDRETRLAYKRVYITDENNSKTEERIYLDAWHEYGDEGELGLPTSLTGEKSSYISQAHNPDQQRLMMFKNGLEYDVRGRVILESVLRWNRVIMDFLYSRARLNHLRSKIYLVETRTGSSGKKPRSSQIGERMPKGGVKLIETPDRSFRIIAPETGAQDAETDYKQLLYMVGSAISMPIHILMVNAENENYASIKEAANPFAQAIVDLQDEWGEHLKSMLRYLIKMAIRLGILDTEYEVEYVPEDTIGEVKKEVVKQLSDGVPVDEIKKFVTNIVEVEKKKKVMRTINIPINLIFPSIIHSDPIKEAQAIKIYLDSGLMSKYTAMLKIGSDPDVELARMELEFEQSMEKTNRMFDNKNNGAPDWDKDASPKDNNTEEGKA